MYKMLKKIYFPAKKVVANIFTKLNLINSDVDAVSEGLGWVRLPACIGC